MEFRESASPPRHRSDPGLPPADNSPQPGGMPQAAEVGHGRPFRRPVGQPEQALAAIATVRSRRVIPWHPRHLP